MTQTVYSSARMVRLRIGANSRAIWLHMERAAASAGLMYDWVGQKGHESFCAMMQQRDGSFVTRSFINK